MQKIKQVSTVVDNTPSPAQEKKKLESEQLKQLEKVIDAYEKKVTEEVLNKTEPKKEEELPIEEIDDSYYYDDMGVKRPNMYSNKRKKDLEKKLKPLDMSSVVLRRRAEQEIPISKHLTIKVRETSGKEDMFMKDQIARLNMNKEEVSRASVHVRMGMYALTFMLLEVNGRELPDCAIKNTPPTKEEIEAFNNKFDYISEYPDDILEVMHTHLQWFKDRVKMLSVGDIEVF